MMRTTIPLVVSALIGLASLGQETLWIRVVGFAQGNTPRILAWVLALFLLGIVFGAWFGKLRCDDSRDEKGIRAFGAYAAMVSALVDACSPFLVEHLAGSSALINNMAVLIMLSAASKAALFPVVHHLGGHWQGEDAGRSIARVYFANILGATLAPLLIGFWLLDHTSTQALMLAMAALAWLAAGLLTPAPKIRWVNVAFMLFTALGVAHQLQATTLWERLAEKPEGGRIGFLQENRHGIVHTALHGDMETVYGGNVYDGKVNIDPHRNTNLIDRVFLLAALQPQAKTALVIGLSSGSWTRVLAAFPGMERIDVVEINPAYLDLIHNRPIVQPILSDPRIHIHVDDGRRWLRRHPETRFDLIVMNNTWHWRAFSTNLLSLEFLQLARNHLTPEGLLAFNSTGSPDVLATASIAFPYAYRWRESNFVYAAMHDFRQPVHDLAIMRLEETARQLDVELHAEGVDKLIHPSWVDINEETLLAKRPLEIIRDANMITEFKHGRR